MAQDNIFRPRNSVVLAKIETTVGVDASPVASDAVLVTIPKISINPQIKQTEEVTGSLDGAGPIYTGMTCELSYDVYLKGSGTGGVAPEWGKLLKACGFSETVLATAVPAAPEACAAGGTTTSAVLGTSASTTAQQYRGMPIVFTGTVPGTSFISDYTAGKLATLTDTMGGSIVATTSYQIPVNVVYGPASASIPSLTHYVYQDGLLYKFLGCRGTAQFKFDANGLGMISFRFMAIFGGKTDTAVVASPVYDATRPPPFQNGKLLLNRVVAAASSLSLDSGAELNFPDDPNEIEGIRPAIHNSRRITGSLNPLETLVATRDIMGDFRAGTRRILHARYGQTAGNRIGLTIPQAHYMNQTPGDRNGFGQVEVPFEAVGRDSGAFLCLY